MFTYRNVSNSRLTIPRIGVVVDPGGTLVSPIEIDDGTYELVQSKNMAAGAAAEEKK